MSPTVVRVKAFAGVIAGVLLLGGCTAAGASSTTHSAGTVSGSASGAAEQSAMPDQSSAPGHSGHGTSAAAPVVVTDADATDSDGSRTVTRGLPKGAYSPSAPSGGTDDYHCQLIDPGLDADTYLTGFEFLPGNPAVVHHAIMFRVPPESVAAVQAKDAESATPGWTCFGDSGIPQMSTGRLAALDNASWLGAWAPGGKPSGYPTGTGVPLAKGSQVVLQIHYNLLAKNGSDASGIRLHLAPPSEKLTALHTMLLPAPVDLPCTASQSGPLCERTAAMGDLARRFGPDAARRIGGLDLLCGIDPAKPVIGPTQSCDRVVKQPITVVAAAGHMHLLGRSIAITSTTGASKGSAAQSPKPTPVLTIPTWNFDDQGSRRLATPLALKPGDRLKVTCTHDASLRDMLPSLAEQPDRHVLWGEGTSDEMCLGILTYTQG